MFNFYVYYSFIRNLCMDSMQIKFAQHYVVNGVIPVYPSLIKCIYKLGINYYPIVCNIIIWTFRSLMY